MRTTIDFDPLFLSSIGFDRMLNVLEAASSVAPFENWPPYDIVRSAEDSYRIEMAVAGSGEDDLTVTQEKNVLIVSGREDGEDEAEYLHRGIAGRSFERRFDLAEHVQVEGASLTDGLLTIELRREVPEELKPRRIEIASAEALPEQQTRRFDGLCLVWAPLRCCSGARCPRVASGALCWSLAAHCTWSGPCRSRGWATWRSPLLLMLHAAYPFVPAGGWRRPGQQCSGPYRRPSVLTSVASARSAE